MGINLSSAFLHLIYPAYGQDKVSRIYSSWADHVTFSTKHAGRHHLQSLLFLAPLEIVQNLPDTHSSEYA